MTDGTRKAPVLEAPGGERRVLLHTCCAPCVSAILEAMRQQGLEPVVFFSNSNIFPHEEYLRRKEECVRYALAKGVEIVDDEYDHEDWRREMAGLEREPERGKRCSRCFAYRLHRAAAYASTHGLKVVATALAASRWKDLAQVNAAGEAACRAFPNVRWWGQNWRKGGLQERRGELVREWKFYNQLYCGCEFAARNFLTAQDGTTEKEKQ